MQSLSQTGILCGVVYDWFVCELMTQASQLDTLSQHFPARTRTGHQDPLECPPVNLFSSPPPPPSCEEETRRQVEDAGQPAHTVGRRVSEERTGGGGSPGTSPAGRGRAGGQGASRHSRFLTRVLLTGSCSIDGIQPASLSRSVRFSVCNTSKRFFQRQRGKQSPAGRRYGFPKAWTGSGRPSHCRPQRAQTHHPSSQPGDAPMSPTFRE